MLMAEVADVSLRKPCSPHISRACKATHRCKTLDYCSVVCRLTALEEGQAVLLAEVADMRVRLQEVREENAADAAAQQQAAAAAVH